MLRCIGVDDPRCPRPTYTWNTWMKGAVAMRKKLAAAVLTVCVVSAAATLPAITNGVPDAGRHPYVGFMVALDEDGFPLWACSGSLISPTVFLTAGHCAEGPAHHVEIWFSEGPVPIDPDYLAAVQNSPEPVSCDASPAFDGYPCQGDAGGAPHPHPDFCIGCGPGLPGFSTRDVGVVELDAAVPTTLVSRYAELPELGLVDTLANKTPIDFVGYGVNFQAQIPGRFLPQPPPFYRWVGLRRRFYAPSELVSGNFKHSEEFLRLALNASKGSGGLCFGDSGGPDLLGGTDIVLGVNSYVTNVNCSGTGYSQRIDIPGVLSWIMTWL
jgi:Trypsin